MASCTVSGDGVASVHLRLPTFFCAPNFSFLMVADAYDAVSAVEGVTRAEIVLDDHHASAEINGGVAAHAGFVETFAGRGRRRTRRAAPVLPGEGRHRRAGPGGPAAGRRRRRPRRARRADPRSRPRRRRTSTGCAGAGRRSGFRPRTTRRCSSIPTAAGSPPRRCRCTCGGPGSPGSAWRRTETSARASSRPGMRTRPAPGESYRRAAGADASGRGRGPGDEHAEQVLQPVAPGRGAVGLQRPPARPPAGRPAPPAGRPPAPGRTRTAARAARPRRRTRTGRPPRRGARPPGPRARRRSRSRSGSVTGGRPSGGRGPSQGASASPKTRMSHSCLAAPHRRGHDRPRAGRRGQHGGRVGDVHEQLHQRHHVERAGRRVLRVPDREGALGHGGGGAPDGRRVGVDAGHPGSAVGRRAGERARRRTPGPGALVPGPTAVASSTAA